MSKRTIIVLSLIIVIVAAFLIYEQSSASNGERYEQLEGEFTSMERIVSVLQRNEKPTLLHVYALKPDCPNCDIEFIFSELVKVQQLKDDFKDLDVITMNIFDYSQEDMGLLQTEIYLAQTPTTVLLNKQGEVVAYQVGKIFEGELEEKIKEALL